MSRSLVVSFAVFGVAGLLAVPAVTPSLEGERPPRRRGRLRRRDGPPSAGDAAVAAAPRAGGWSPVPCRGSGRRPGRRRRGVAARAAPAGAPPLPRSPESVGRRAPRARPRGPSGRRRARGGIGTGNAPWHDRRPRDRHRPPRRWAPQHLQPLDPSVSVGDVVTAGQRLGVVRPRGGASASHCGSSLPAPGGPARRRVRRPVAAARGRAARSPATALRRVVRRHGGQCRGVAPSGCPDDIGAAAAEAVGT